MGGLAPYVPVFLALNSPDVVGVVAVLDGLPNLCEELSLDESLHVFLIGVDGNLRCNEEPVDGRAVPRSSWRLCGDVCQTEAKVGEVYLTGGHHEVSMQ